MAWNSGGVLDIKRGAVRGPVDISGVLDDANAAGTRLGQAYDEVGTSLQSAATSLQAPTAGSVAPEWGDAEFGINDKTGEVQLPDGTVIKGDAPTLMQLATLKSKDGSPLPKLKRLQKGFTPRTQKWIQETIDGIPVESDFFGEAWAATKGTLGLTAAAIDSMFGNDDPGNEWSDAQANLPKSQTIGQVKAGEARWYSSFDAFKSGLGETLGNVGGTVAGAIPLALAGAAAGNAPGAILGAGAAVTGAGAAFGEQATQFYDDALATMQKMSPDTLMAESPMFRKILRENPEMEYDEAMREVAIRGARAAGTPAAMLGAVEGMVGGRLAGNFLARMGVNKAILGSTLPAVVKKPGLAMKAGRALGRMGVGGAAEFGEETAESMLGQSAGAAATGIGSTNPLDHFDAEEGIAAAQGGMLFGLFGGRRHASPADAALNSDIGAALGANSDMGQTHNQAGGLTAAGDLLPAPLRRTDPTVNPPDNGTAAINRVVTLEHPGAIDGQSGRTAEVPPEQREQVAAMLENVLDERFSDESGSWQDKVDQISQDVKNGGRHLLGELMAIRQAQEAETRQMVPGRGPAPMAQPGSPDMAGPSFGDPWVQGEPPFSLDGMPPEQQAPMDEAPQAPIDDPAQMQLQEQIQPGPRENAPLGLRERREAQDMRQQDMAEQSAANPQALEADPALGIEDQIYRLQDEISQMRAALEQRPPRDPRKKFFVQSIRDAEDQLMALEDQWVAEREAGGPRGVAQDARVDSPEPLEAGGERTPDGRPMGVTPAALPNPEPMAPAEAQSRALTQRKRRGGEDAMTADQVSAAAATSDQQVMPSTPEPAGDIKAQVADLRDENSARDAVFVAEGQTMPGKPKKGEILATRAGVGTLLTTSPDKATRFERGTLNDKEMAKILGYSQTKGDALRRGKGVAPAVVQAVTKKGAVAADQIVAPADVPAAKKSLKKLSPKSKVEVTTPEKAQERRSLKGRKSEPKTKPKKSLKKPATDEDKTGGQTEAGNYKKRHERVDGMEFAVETEVGQKRRPEWPALKHAYGYIKRTLGKDGEHIDAFFGDAEFSPDMPVFVVDQFVNGKFDEHKVMLGFTSEAEARKGYNDNYAKGWKGLHAITEMSWGDFKAWSKDKGATQQRAERSANKVETRADRALSDPTSAEAATPNDTVEKASKRVAETVMASAEPVTLPDRMTTNTGAKGSTIDMRVLALDEKAIERLERMLKVGSMTAKDRATVERALRDFDQMNSLLDARVAAAEADLRKVLDKAPDGKARMEKHEEENKDTKNSPIVTIPLMVSEIRGFLKAVRAEAKAEMGSYSPANSVARQLVVALLPRMQNAMQYEFYGKQALKYIAALTDADIEGLLRYTHKALADSTVAKQVMRGATEVAHATRRAEVEAVGTRATPDFADHRIDGVEADVQPHATEHGKIPAEAQGLVNTWVQQFEKLGNKFSAPVHVMSIADARKLFPGAFVPGSKPNGKFLRNVDDKGKVTDYVLAVDWENMPQEGVAVEVLAHEFGHMVTTEMYSRMSPSAQKAIDNAYNRWLASTRGRSVDDVLREHMPGAERMAFKGGATNMAYATSFWEWSARNAALYVLDPNRPHLGAVEKFFKSIADTLRSIYAKIMRSPEPDHAWAEALDRWVAGVSELTTMPRVEETNYNHEEFADKQEGSDRLRAAAYTKQAKLGLEGAISMLPGRETTAEAQKVMADILGNEKVSLLKRIGLSLLTLRQIERMYRDTPIGPALTGWVRNQQLKAQTANQALEAGSQWMERANQLDAKVRTALERIMYEATHYGIHPDKPLTHKDNAHLLRGSDYVQGVHAKRYMGLKAKWDAMTAADANTSKIYRGLRLSFTQLHKKTLNKQIEMIQNANFTPKVKEDIVASLKRSRAMHMEGPYFPLMRVGNWIVKVQLPAFIVGKGGKENGESFSTKAAAREEMRNQKALNPGAKLAVEPLAGEKDSYVVRVYQSGVYFFHSATEARNATAEIEAEVRENYDAAGVNYDDALAAKEPLDGEAGVEGLIISPPKGAIDNYEDLKKMHPEMLNEIRALLREGKMDPEVANTIERLAIEALPENSYRKSLLPRQNVFGASKQMLRSYANRFQGAAHHYAVVEHGAAINKNWSRMHEVAGEGFEGGSRVLNVLAANQQAVRDRTANTKTNTVLNFITNASSMFSLAFSPAYVLTNALQPTMITAPVLAGLTGGNGKTVGMTKAAKYMKEAYAGAIPFFTTRGFNDFVNETKAMMGKRGNDHTLQDGAKEILGKFGKTPEEQAMLESLLDRGTLDFSWLNALEDAMRAESKLGQKWAALQRVGMALPQQVEAMNRVTTALAAYRLAKDEKMFTDETTLQQFADDTVADTQLDYSRLNRPVAFNTKGLNVILQFKIYMQGMYMLFARQASLAMAKPLPGESAADHKARRKQGMKTMGYLLMTHAAGAGTLGLGPVTWMAKLALVAIAMSNDDDDDDWKSGTELYKDMTEGLFGEYGAQVAQHGVFAMLGVDMTDRIGVPELYDSRFAGNKASDSAATGFDKVFLYSMGAPYSNARRIVQGLSDAKDGNLSKAVNGLPSGARAVARSIKWASEGIVDQDGDTFIKRDELSWKDLAINTLALQPLKTSNAYSQRSEERDTVARIMLERKRLLQEARTGGDYLDDLREFNRKTPKQWKLSNDDIQKSREAKRGRESGKLRKDEKAIKAYLE